MSAIVRISLRALWGTGGEKACEAEVELRNGARGTGAAALTEASAGVDAAAGELGDALAGIDAADQWAADWALAECDGTPRMDRIGSGMLLAASLAVARAAAAEAGVPLWRHLGGVAARTLPVPQIPVARVATQEGDVAALSVLPVGVPGFAAALAAAHTVREGVRQARFEGLAAACEAIATAGLGEDVLLAVECSAATVRAGLPRDAAIATVRVVDGVSGRRQWQALADAVGPAVQLVADACRPADSGLPLVGAADGFAGAVRLDPLRAGSVTEVLQLAAEAHAAGLGVLLADDWPVGIDDGTAALALATGAGRIGLGTCGGLSANTLLRIEKKLANSGRYAANTSLRR